MRTLNHRASLPLVLALPFVLGGCASEPRSPLGDPADVHRPVVVQTDQWRAGITIRRDDGISVTMVSAPRTETWRHLKTAWLDVGLPVPAADEAGYRLRLSNHPVTRRLGRTPLSSYLSCGSSPTGLNADTHRISLTVQSVVREIGVDSTEVHTRVDARATPTQGTSTSAVECTSRGTLENHLATRMLHLLAASMVD